MKITSRVILIIVVVFIVILGFSMKGSYNSMVTEQEDITAKWGQVQVNYQLRADKMNQLMGAIKGQANFERGTLTDIVNARAKAMQVTSNVNVNDLSQENINKVQQAQDMLSKVYAAGVRVITENYPQLQTNQAFLNLQAEIAETENKIAQSRRDFNKSVQLFNSHIRRFPANITASMFGFKPQGYFQNAAGTENAPDINFDNMGGSNNNNSNGSNQNNQNNNNTNGNNTGNGNNH